MVWWELQCKPDSLGSLQSPADLSWDPCSTLIVWTPSHVYFYCLFMSVFTFSHPVPLSPFVPMQAQPRGPLWPVSLLRRAGASTSMLPSAFCFGTCERKGPWHLFSFTLVSLLPGFSFLVGAEPETGVPLIRTCGQDTAQEDTGPFSRLVWCWGAGLWGPRLPEYWGSGVSPSCFPLLLLPSSLAQHSCFCQQEEYLWHFISEMPCAVRISWSLM